MVTMARKPVPAEVQRTQFQEWFEQALERRGLSLAEVARRVDSDYTHLWKILRGSPEKYPTSRRPGYSLTVALGQELGDPVGALEAAGYLSPTDDAPLENREAELVAAYRQADGATREQVLRVVKALLGG